MIHLIIFWTAWIVKILRKISYGNNRLGENKRTMEKAVFVHGPPSYPPRHNLFYRNVRSVIEKYARPEKHYENVKQTLEGCAPIPEKSSGSKSRANYSGDVFKSCSKDPHFRFAKNHDELCWNLQAVLLATSILVLSYNGARYGRSEYSLMENGKTVHGSVPLYRTVVTLSLGYSPPYSILSAISAVMLLYSLVSKKASWSLPSMVLCMADLVCDVGDAIVAIWLFFASLKMATAILYTVGTLVIILGEFWVWSGVLQLYEHRTFK